MPSTDTYLEYFERNATLVHQLLQPGIPFDERPWRQRHTIVAVGVDRARYPSREFAFRTSGHFFEKRVAFALQGARVGFLSSASE